MINNNQNFTKDGLSVYVQKTNKVNVFTNEEMGLDIRTVNIDGYPYFVGKDIAEILGYSNPRKALSDHVDEDDKKDGVTIRDSIGREQKPILINESGLYSLIIRSQLPNAQKFKRWVTSEVLPSIRKHGLYAVDEVLANPDILISALLELKTERERNASLQNKVAVQSQQLLELQPKASYYDVVLNCTDLIPISVIAKDYGWSATQMNKYLANKKVQYSQGDGKHKIWLLYQKYAKSGYTSTKTHVYNRDDDQPHTKVHTYWTQSGRLFIYDLLKSDGILPLIERD